MNWSRASVVPRRISEVKPGVGTFDGAVEAYRAGRLDECIFALRGKATPEASALLARALTRLGRVQEALNACFEVDESTLALVRRGEQNILKAQAALRLGRSDDAQNYLLEARVAAYSSDSPALQADYELAEAQARFAAKDLAGTSAAIERSLAVSPVPLRPESATTYFVPLGVVRARALDLRGLLARAADGLHAQLPWARLAFSALDAHPGADQWLSATLLSNFASLAFEIGDPELLDELQQRTATMEWTDNMRLYHFNAVRASGWLSALRGDHIAAFREFRRSSELAPSRAWKIESVLERSFLARELGQDLLAEDELNYAVELAQDVGPPAGADADPFPSFSALVKLAELVAKRDPTEARQILNRYRAARAACPPIYFNATDPTWQAKEEVAEASVARAEGRMQTAFDLLVKAFEAYDKLGSRWQAALVALELAEMSEQPFFHGYAGREARYRPQSWLARRLAALSDNPSYRGAHTSLKANRGWPGRAH